MTEETEDKKPTFWQKLKQLTLTITAITSLIGVLSGAGFFFWNKTDQQDKVQESTYNLLSKRMEQLTINVKVMQKSIENLEKINQILLTRMSISHPNHRIEEIVKVEESEQEVVTIITEAIDNPDAPPKIEYKGKARLPDFTNIQQVVSYADEAIDGE